MENFLRSNPASSQEDEKVSCGAGQPRESGRGAVRDSGGGARGWAFAGAADAHSPTSGGCPVCFGVTG